MADELVRVYASPDPFDAELMRGRLESEGIPTMVKGEGGGPYRFGPVYVWVRGEDELTARTVLDAVRSGAFALEVDERAASVHPGDATG
jgi:Putative prokaryotic signal transducing protein